MAHQWGVQGDGYSIRRGGARYVLLVRRITMKLLCSKRG